MSRINYSKWDKLSEYDDLSDDENAQSVPFSSGPRVTRLDQPSTVTRTATGEIVIQDATVVADDEAAEPARESRDRNILQNSLPSFPDARDSQALSNHHGGKEDVLVSPTASQVPSHWTEKGGSCEYQDKTVYWSQDRLTVTFRVRLPVDEPPASRLGKPQHGRYLCTVSNMLPYGRRDSAVSQERCHLRIFDRGEGRGTVVLDGVLPHAIHANQGDDDEEGDSLDQVDWVVERLEDEINNTNTKYIEISLNKASPMAGLTLWWKQPFVDAPEIDLETVSTSNARTQAFASAWKEAHQQFTEKIKLQKAGMQLDDVSPGESDRQETN